MWSKRRLFSFVLLAVIVELGSTEECNGSCDNSTSTVDIEILTFESPQVSIDEDYVTKDQLNALSKLQTDASNQNKLIAPEKNGSTPAATTERGETTATKHDSDVAKGMLAGPHVEENEQNKSRCFRTECCDVFVPDSARFNVDGQGNLRLPFSKEIFAHHQYVRNETGVVLCYPNAPDFLECRKWLLEMGEVRVLGNLTLYQEAANKWYPVGHYAYNQKNNGYWVCVPPEALASAELAQKTSTYYVVGYAISEVCLIILFFLRLRSTGEHNPALIACIAVLFVAFLLLILRYTIDMSGLRGICVMVGLLSHYSFLAYFFWLNVLAFLSLKCRKKGHSNKPNLKAFVRQSIYGWGLPLVVTLLAFSRDFNEEKHRPNFATYCWINDFFIEMGFFYLPIGVTLMINAILILLSIFKFGDSENEDLDTPRMNTLPLKVAVILGFMWIFEIASWSQGDDKRYWLAFDLLNSLQGAFLLIFIAFADRCCHRQQPPPEQPQPVFYKASLPMNDDIKLNLNNTP